MQDRAVTLIPAWSAYGLLSSRLWDVRSSPKMSCKDREFLGVTVALVQSMLLRFALVPGQVRLPG